MTKVIEFSNDCTDYLPVKWYFWHLQMLQCKACTHLCVYDVEHVGSISHQSVGYPYVHNGARQSAWPIVYHLKQQHWGNGYMQMSGFDYLYFRYHQDSNDMVPF